jgi:prophage DNA circulation protein
MNLVAAIRSEERKVEKELRSLKARLNGLRTAAKALGNSAGREVAQVKKRVLSAAGRAKISAAAKRRWAKVKGGAKKAVS